MAKAREIVADIESRHPARIDVRLTGLVMLNNAFIESAAMGDMGDG